MSECAVKVGMTATFDPYVDMTGSFGQKEMIGEKVTGKVVYVNETHHWFTVKQRNGLINSFHFSEIGTGSGKKVVLS